MLTTDVTSELSKWRLNVVDVIRLSSKAKTLQSGDGDDLLQHQNKLLLNWLRKIFPNFAAVLRLGGLRVECFCAVSLHQLKKSCTNGSHQVEGISERNIMGWAHTVPDVEPEWKRQTRNQNENRWVRTWSRKHNLTGTRASVTVAYILVHAGLCGGAARREKTLLKKDGEKGKARVASICFRVQIDHLHLDNCCLKRY